MKLKIIILMVLTGIVVGARFVASQPAAPSNQETVVLLHGLARSDKAMKRMAEELETEGYTVINHNYPSTSATIEVLTKDIFKALTPRIKEAETVHFVTHSMGGIILRHHLEEYDIPNLGRTVMLAPPSRGSEVPDRLGNIFLFKWINGPAGNQLGTGTNSHPLRLKVPEFELGIIAGDRSINPILSMLIPGPDDGKVALSRVKPANYTDYFQIHATHPCIARNKKAIAQTKHFLEHGCFADGASISIRDADQTLNSPLEHSTDQHFSNNPMEQDALSTKETNHD